MLLQVGLHPVKLLLQLWRRLRWLLHCRWWWRRLLHCRWLLLHCWWWLPHCCCWHW
jgi:hypothetical protein